MTNYGQIKINGQTVTARRLITPAERLVLSNVCPTIPHDLILQELQNIGLSFVSPMVFLKINSTSPEFSHILSFRRQIYVNPPNFNVPESIIINHEDTSYRIFLSLDNLTCCNCKKAGHKASNCSEQTFSNTPTSSQPLANQNPILNQIAPQEDNDQITLRQNEPTTSQILAPDNEKLNSNLRTNVTSNKRSASAILTFPPHPSDAISDNLFVTPQNITVPKKLKAMTPNSQMLQPVKQYIDDHKEFILNFNQLANLLDNVHGSPDAIIVVNEYTTDYPSLITMLESIHPLLQDRTIKTRCTKLKKKLAFIMFAAASLIINKILFEGTCLGK
ncbi:unnamed protein product [Psylliodes chrysocephalus]|uniref:CCHC-type domain-containing protein n=1 Tax=Psylliodes chrysocephalus TaxID=3402493 RepID=A0A9P0D1N0_9CUCU|nr:unnamed protein product [Psylliodes chrysocephala]